VLGGSEVKFSQNETGIDLALNQQELKPVVTTFVLKTK
jgi:hypothetical protein